MNFVPSSPARESVAKWMADDFVRSFHHEANPKHWPLDSRETGSFAIPLLCLTFCNAAAGLVEGTPSVDSLHCISFIQTWFKLAPSPSASRYKKRAAALYSLFRHGLAHHRVPGMLDLEDDRTMGWAIDRKFDRTQHLEVLSSGRYFTSTGKHDGHFRILVQPDILFDDCLVAFTRLQQEAAKSRKLAERVPAAAIAAAGTRKVGAKPESRNTRNLILARLRKIVDSPDPYRLLL